MAGDKFNTTAELKVSPRIVDQVIGQEDAVRIIRKAARQRRHVLLIGDPGTGKSMLGMALAELLPKEKLVDVVAFPNPNDENQPFIRTLPAGQGRELVNKSRYESANVFRFQNMIMIVIMILTLIAPIWAFNHYTAVGGYLLGGLMFIAFFFGGLLFFASFILFMNLGRKADGRMKAPKVVVDNHSRKQSPFFDATGAHAGALLGDVLHDPFQCFYYAAVNKKSGGAFKPQLLERIFMDIQYKHKKEIIRNKKGYEAIFLNKEELTILGETKGKISPVEVLSINKQDYDGKMIKLKTSQNQELIVTPEHKIAVNENGKTSFVEAGKIKTGQEVITKSEDIIIDEKGIIKTYDSRQQEQCSLYYQYLDIKSQNPLWGYKKIAKSMGQKTGKTRWWHQGRHIPVPIQTIRWLKDKGLLPLKCEDKRTQTISKILGATFGDGGIFKNLNGIFLSSMEKEAVMEFGNDLKTVFGDEIHLNSRIIECGEKGHSWCYQNTNRNIIRFFLALGAPKGNKTSLELNIPLWISLNETLQDEFYGSFFGSELGVPKVHKQRNRLQTLDLAITGTEKLDENRRLFFNKIRKYLAEKGINSTSLIKRKTNNEDLFLFRLMISIKFENVVNFIKNVKMNYCNHKKIKLNNAISEFATIKKDKFNDLTSRGYGAESAMRILKLTPKALYYILNEDFN